MPLRPRVLEALPTLEWLFDESARQQGRSLALAVAAIRCACRNPGTVISLFDHYFPGNITSRRLSVIQPAMRMIRYDPRLRPYSERTQATDSGLLIRLTLPNPILDWLPVDQSWNPEWVSDVFTDEFYTDEQTPDDIADAISQIAPRIAARREERRNTSNVLGQMINEATLRSAQVEREIILDRMARVNPSFDQITSSFDQMAAKLSSPKPVKMDKPKPLSALDRLLNDKD